MSTVKVNEQNFENEVLCSKKPVLIDFYAEWCGPCRALSPIVEEIADSREDIKVCKVNVDENMSLAQKYSVESIPTLVVVKDGSVVNKVVGAVPRSTIEEMLD